MVDTYLNLSAGLVTAIAVWWEYELTLKDKIATQVQEHISTAQLNNLSSEATGAGTWVAAARSRVSVLSD